MSVPIILASGSLTRRRLLEAAAVPFDVVTAPVDEPGMRAALEAEGATPRDVADALAEMKAVRVAEKRPGTLVIGADQVLDFEGRSLGKADTPDALMAQLSQMSGKRHSLLSAAVINEDGRPVWRHVGVARLHMRELSSGYIADYVARNWDKVRHSAGGYLIEGEGVRLFTRIDGDHFHVLGLPLIELLSYLILRGRLPT